MSCLAVKDPRLAGYLVLQMDGWMDFFWGGLNLNGRILSLISYEMCLLLHGFRFGVGFFINVLLGFFESEKISRYCI